MTRGRPPLGTKIVERFDADPNAKDRLQILLQTLTGSLSVHDACLKLDISQARFFELRNDMLQAALDSLQPKSPGRPARQLDPASERIHQLEREITDLRVHLVAAQLREEIALAMPHLAQRNKTARKKKNPTAPKTNPAALRIIPPTNQSSDDSMPESSDT